jgi:molybdate transport system ATP-binding protein
VDGLRLDVTVPLRSFALELALEAGAEPLAVAGPSGAGKTTLLRAIAGLVRPSRGAISLGKECWLDTERGIDLAPEERSAGFLFQDYALFPHMSVAKNVAFSGGEPGPLLERFGIAHLARVRPRELSGGERQRVALARALGRNPKVLLLDEPLAALDVHTRGEVRASLHELLQQLGLPAFVVTHDFADAAALATRIAVVADGRLVQLGTPAELVGAPATPFVASFTGGNLLPGQARPGPRGLTEVVLDAGGVVYSTDEAHGRVGAVVHPWEVSLALVAPADSALNHVTAPIASLAPQGNRILVRVGPVVAEITAASAQRLGLEPGRAVVATFKATATRLVPLA